MRVLRVRYQSKVFYAALHEESVACLNPQLGFVDPIPLDEVTVLPVVAPSKIVCAGLNYKEHAAELGMPVPEEPTFFLKPPTSIIGAGQAIMLPAASAQVDYEAELAMIIGKETRYVKPENVNEHLFGFACANDVTARDIQKKDSMFGRCKGFDTFCPIGPWIETEVTDPGNLSIKTLRNGEEVQSGNTADMIFHPFELVAHISQVMTLLPGDVVLTGTPAGIGPMHAGDEIRIEIDTVGLLINPVKDSLGREEGEETPVQ